MNLQKGDYGEKDSQKWNHMYLGNLIVLEKDEILVLIADQFLGKKYT